MYNTMHRLVLVAINLHIKIELSSFILFFTVSVQICVVIDDLYVIQ